MRINVDPRVDRGPTDEAIQTKMVFDIPDNLSQISFVNAVPENVLKKAADRKSPKEIFKAFKKSDLAPLYDFSTYEGGKFGQSVRLPLDSVISPEHPLFDVFPDLAKELDIRIIEKPSGNTGAHFNPKTNTIAIGAQFIGNDDYVATAIIHELAHVMQTKGGLPGGGTRFNAPRRVYNNLYDNFAMAESFDFIEGDMNLNQFVFSDERPKDQARKLARFIYQAQTNVMKKNREAPMSSKDIFPGDPYSSTNRNVSELPFRDEVRREFDKLIDEDSAKAIADVDAFEKVGIKVMPDPDFDRTGFDNYMRLRGEFMARLQEGYAQATEGLSPQERRKLFPMDLATEEDIYPTLAGRQKGVVAVPLGMQKKIQAGRGPLKRAIVLDRSALATKYPSEQGLIDVVPAEGMDDPTGGLINPDAFTPEIKRQLRFQGSEAQSAGFEPRAKSQKDVNDLFEFLGDEGLGAEHPSIFNEIEKYTTDINEFGADKLEALKTRADYSAYKEDLDRTLLQAYPDGKIPVSRRKPYAPLTVQPPIKTEEFVDLKDVAFVGYDAEKELIVNTSVGLRSFRLLPDAVEMTPEQIQKQINSAQKFTEEFPEEAAQAGLDSEIVRLQDLLEKAQQGSQKFADGGLVSLAPIARNMYRGPRALESLAPVARNMDRSMLRSG